MNKEKAKMCDACKQIVPEKDGQDLGLTFESGDGKAVTIPLLWYCNSCCSRYGINKGE